LAFYCHLSGLSFVLSFVQFGATDVFVHMVILQMRNAYIIFGGLNRRKLVLNYRSLIINGFQLAHNNVSTEALLWYWLC